MEEKISPAERKELEALRAAAALREREEAGIQTGKLACGTSGCPFDEKEVDMKANVHRRVNEDTGVVENEVTIWEPLTEDQTCTECDYPLVLIPPGALSVFPRNYRWVYPKPVK